MQDVCVIRCYGACFGLDRCIYVSLLALLIKYTADFLGPQKQKMWQYSSCNMAFIFGCVSA
jgi:hypothetical protein